MSARWNRLIRRVCLMLLPGLLLVLVLPVRAATLSVNATTGTVDGICDATCLLEDALFEANSSVGVLDTITFDGLGAGPHTITLAAGEIITDAVIIDGATAAVGGTCAVGAYVPQISITVANGDPVFTVQAGGSGSTLRGLHISNASTAIALEGSDNNVIECNYLGTNLAGDSTGAVVNTLTLNNASSNTVQDNTIGMTGTGLILSGTSATNTVRRNRLGASYNGTTDISTGTGIVISSTGGNIIGAAGAGNTISGHDQAGIQLLNGTTGNTIAANFIGTTGDGLAALPNVVGVLLRDGATGNTVGGGNLISGNDVGVLLQDAGTTTNTVRNNRIGTDSTGGAALPNTLSGVEIDAAPGNTIGGAGGRNLISGNTGAAVLVGGSGATGNSISHNAIGTEDTEATALANGSGITLNSGSNTVSNNRISGNSGTALALNSDGNTVQANIIGLNSASADLGNTAGIVINGSNNLVNSTNRIAYSGGSGITVQSGTGNTLRANLIFDNTGSAITLAGGANNDQPAPQLFHATAALNNTPGNPNINVDLPGFAAATYTLDVYSSSTNTPDCEAETYLGAATVDASVSVTNVNITAITPTGGGYISVTATDASGNTSILAACVQEQTAPAFTFSPLTLPNALVGALYNQTVTVTAPAATPPLTLALISGATPAGITFTPATGLLSGTPPGVATSSFRLRATDANRYYADQDYALDVVTLPDIVLNPDNPPDPVDLPAATVGTAYTTT
nr:right-handed parallel beta-helix repeat-containing protein [Anaerolineae bacterium]